MAEKKEDALSPADARLKLWLGFAKFCFAVLVICSSIVKMNREDNRRHVRVAQLESGDCGEDAGGAEAKKTAEAAKPKAKP